MPLARQAIGIILKIQHFTGRGRTCRILCGRPRPGKLISVSPDIRFFPERAAPVLDRGRKFTFLNAPVDGRAAQGDGFSYIRQAK